MQIKNNNKKINNKPNEYYNYECILIIYIKFVKKL